MVDPVIGKIWTLRKIRGDLLYQGIKFAGPD